MVNNKKKVRGNRVRGCPKPVPEATQGATSRRARAALACRTITLADYIIARPSKRGSNKGSNKRSNKLAAEVTAHETNTTETNTTEINTNETNTNATNTNATNTNATNDGSDKHDLTGEPIRADTGAVLQTSEPGVSVDKLVHQAPVDGADTPPRSPTAASPLKRAYSNDSDGYNDGAPFEEPAVSSIGNERRVAQPLGLAEIQVTRPKTDNMASVPFPQAQIALEEACWALNPMTVLLLLANGREGLHLGGVDHRDGNSPLQMAVDGLIYQLDHLRHHHPENVGYREACRRNFHTIMTALVKHMTLTEMQNWNNYDGTNAAGKLAFHAFDWRSLQDLIEAMNRLSGDPSGESMFQYNVGKSCRGYEGVVMPWENDSHVVGCLREKFWDPLNQWWAFHVHPCGKFAV